MKTVIIDNYDSFTFNLNHILKEEGAEVTVLRNDKFELPELSRFEKIVLSPGPGIPQEAGKLLDVVRTYAAEKSILGVCLGEQAIGEVFGAGLINLTDVYHGVQTPIDIVGEDYIFNHLPKRLPVGRYHSWVVDTKNFPSCLSITAKSEEGYIMALRHKEFDVHGIQFHPESVLTPEGRTILHNFLHHTAPHN